jgi:hypothetical protein
MCYGRPFVTDFNKVWGEGWAKNGSKAFSDYFVFSQKQKVIFFLNRSKLRCGRVFLRFYASNDSISTRKPP